MRARAPGHVSHSPETRIRKPKLTVAKNWQHFANLLTDCFFFSSRATAAAAGARAEEAAREGAEEALRGNGAAPERGGEEARRERTGS